MPDLPTGITAVDAGISRRLGGDRSGTPSGRRLHPLDLGLEGDAPRAAGDRVHPAFRSILYQEDEACVDTGPKQAPAYFRDLNLDQIVGAITAGKGEYDLESFFHRPLETVGAIQYRHEVMRDLEDEHLLGDIKSFASDMRLMRKKLEQAGKLYYQHQKNRWFLHAVETYCAAVGKLKENLSRVAVSSRGLVAFRHYVADYVASEPFVTLSAAAAKLVGDLAAIRYCILIKDSGFKVRKCCAEEDYSAEVAATFRKFQQGAAKDYRIEFIETPSMSHIEAKVLDFVALLHPEVFSGLDGFCGRYRDYAEPVLMRFDREIHFYTAYMEYMATFKRAGLRFCYPEIATSDKEVHDEDGFDLALATKLVSEKAPVVCNSFRLRNKERIFVVSGPNQGGKTTFSRAFGQLHHLASIGCPVPGSDARLFLFDAMYTHFEREEDIKNLHGKLQDDLVRIHEVLERATPRSVVIMNEIFNSTTLTDAIFLARKVIDRLIELDLLCVCVTFLEELASLSEKTVSMVSTVVPDDPARRTYKVVRRPADGRSYAISIAEKYRLTYDHLKARISEQGAP